MVTRWSGVTSLISLRGQYKITYTTKEGVEKTLEYHVK